MVKVLRSFVRGPLEPFVVGFADGLCRQGYSRSSSEQHVCFIAHLDRWMTAGGVGLAELSAPVMKRFLAERLSAGYVEYRSMKALRPLLDYLSPLGVLPVGPVAAPGPVEELLAGYRSFLLAARGLTAGTARGYVDAVRPFVTGQLHGNVLDLTGLTAVDVTGFVLAACPGRATGSAKLIVCALRSLLRWLHLTGVIAAPLAGAVPAVAGWRLAGLPSGLEPAQLRRLLASCDRRGPTGRRDYAILRWGNNVSTSSLSGPTRSGTLSAATWLCCLRNSWRRTVWNLLLMRTIAVLTSACASSALLPKRDKPLSQLLPPGATY